MRKRILILLLFSIPFFTLQAKEIKLKSDGRNAVIIKENNYSKLRLSQDLNEFQAVVIKTDKGSFTQLGVNGYSSTTVIGYPKLPVKSELIEIPLGAEVQVVVKISTSTEYSLSELGLDYPILPVQAPLVKDNSPVPPLAINRQAYNSNQFAPADLATVDILGMMRGIRVARLNLYPVQYNPVTGRIKVFEYLVVEVSFLHPDIGSTLESKKKNNIPYFSGINNMLFNYKELPSSAKDTITGYPVKYVIVSHPSFENMLQPFINWKRKKGFTVVEAYTTNPSVGTTTTSIKNYLKGLYDNSTPDDPAPSFILIVGDIAQVPSFNGTAGGHKSDMYYAEYTGDFLPEVFIGRFSAETESQLQPQIDKTLEYEQYLMPDPSFLGEVAMISGVDANFAPIHGNGQINYGTTNYFNASHGLNSHTYLYPLSGSSGPQIIQDVSNGVGYANYTAHGSSDGWADPSFGISDIAGLQNAHKYPLMVGNCCQTNTFDVSVCFGEALLRASNKGALGYIGGTNNTYWDEDFYWGVGVRAIVANPVWTAGGQKGAYDVTFHDHGEPFSEWYISQGSMVYAGNMAVTVGSPGSMDYYWEIYMLMGDPSLMVYLGVPPAMNVSYNNLMPLAASSFTINCEPYSYIAVSKNGVLHGTALADSNGLAVVALDPITTPGYATIVITGQNLQPFIDSVMVASPTGPYVLMQDLQVIEGVGNNNGLVDYGETINLDLTLKNWGLATANAVTASLTSSDLYVSITDPTEAFGNIAGGDITTQNNAFTFTVANELPDQHNAFFTLTVNDNAGNSWSENFKIKLNSPVFQIITLTIDDISAGNGNGYLDAGETVDLIVTTKNIGHTDAPSTLATLMTSSSQLTLNNSNANLNTVTAGNITFAVFNATVSNLAQLGDEIPIDFSVASGPYTASQAFILTVGKIVEDWETGTFTHYTWGHSGNQPWIITTEDPYEGVYCSKSGAIGNFQQSELFISGTVLLEDSISFYRKVSSEDSYDKLAFFIDGTTMGEWSGEMGWQRFAYKVTPGDHLFKWRYKKDYSEIGGSDAAWIDFVEFPPMNGLTTNISSKETNSFAFQLFPNPASAESQLILSLDKTRKISLKLFDSMGQEVRLILQETNLAAGFHAYTISTSGLSKGIYFCHISRDMQTSVVKLVVQ